MLSVRSVTSEYSLARRELATHEGVATASVDNNMRLSTYIISELAIRFYNNPNWQTSFANRYITVIPSGFYPYIKWFFTLGDDVQMRSMIQRIESLINKRFDMWHEPGSKVIELFKEFYQVANLELSTEESPRLKAVLNQVKFEFFPNGAADMPVRTGMKAIAYRTLEVFLNRPSLGIKFKGLLDNFVREYDGIVSISGLQDRLEQIAGKLLTTVVLDLLADEENQAENIQDFLKWLCDTDPSFVMFLQRTFSPHLDIVQQWEYDNSRQAKALNSIATTFLKDFKAGYFPELIRKELLAFLKDRLMHIFIIAIKNSCENISFFPVDTFVAFLNMDCNTYSDKKKICKDLSDSILKMAFPPSPGFNGHNGSVHLPVPVGIQKIIFSYIKDDGLPIWLGLIHSYFGTVASVKYSAEELRENLGVIEQRTCKLLAKVGWDALVKSVQEEDEDFFKAIAETFSDIYLKDSQWEGELSDDLKYLTTEVSRLIPDRGKKALEGKFLRHTSHLSLQAMYNFDAAVKNCSLRYANDRPAWKFTHKIFKAFSSHLKKFEIAETETAKWVDSMRYPPSSEDRLAKWREIYGDIPLAYLDVAESTKHIRRWSERLMEELFFVNSDDLPIPEFYRQDVFDWIRDSMLPGILENLMKSIKDRSLIYKILINMSSPSEFKNSETIGTVEQQDDEREASIISEDDENLYGDVLSYLLKTSFPSIYNILLNATNGFNKADMSDTLEKILDDIVKRNFERVLQDGDIKLFVNNILEVFNDFLGDPDLLKDDETSIEDIKKEARDTLASRFMTAIPDLLEDTVQNIFKKISRIYKSIDDYLDEQLYLGKPFLLLKRIFDVTLMGSFLILKEIALFLLSSLSEVAGVKYCLHVVKKLYDNYHGNAADVFMDFCDREEHNIVLIEIFDILMDAVCDMASQYRNSSQQPLNV